MSTKRSSRYYAKNQKTAWWLDSACILSIFMMVFQTTMALSKETISFYWDWEPGNSGYTAGPNGDVVFDIYMRSDAEDSYAYNFPIIGVVDNCLWDIDRYRCQTTLDFEFDPGTYYFVAVAYLVNSPEQKSISSNEATYVAVSTIHGPTNQPSLGPSDEPSDVANSDGGSDGRCFVGSVVERKGRQY